MKIGTLLIYIYRDLPLYAVEIDSTNKRIIEILQNELIFRLKSFIIEL